MRNAECEMRNKSQKMQNVFDFDVDLAPCKGVGGVKISGRCGVSPQRG
jgi:hypothetical protein